MSLVHNEGQRQGTARQRVIFKALYAHNTRRGNLDGLCIEGTVLRWGRAVDRIVQLALAAKLKHHVLRILKNAVGRKIDRHGTHTAAAAAVVVLGTWLGKVEPTRFAIHAAAAAAGGNIPETRPVNALSIPAREVELLIGGVEGKARAGRRSVEAGAGIGAHKELRRSRGKLLIRHLPEEGQIDLVGQIVVGQQHSPIGDVFDLHPVTVTVGARHVETEVFDRRLADDQRTARLKRQLKAHIARSGVFFSRCGIKRLLPAVGCVQRQRNVRRRVSAEGTVNGKTVCVIQADAVLFRKGKVCVQLVPGPGLLGSIEHESSARFQAFLRQNPAVVFFPVGNAEAREVDGFFRHVCQLDPIGEIPVLIT